MIRQFLKEYAVWYAIYGLMTGLYFLNFYLYQLPMSYFYASLFLNLVILLALTIWLYLAFRQKMRLLQHFFSLQELTMLSSPSDLAYREVLQDQKRAEEAQLHALKSQVEDLQGLVKMWSHQMKVPLSVLSLMAQTEQLDATEVRKQMLRLENYLETLLSYLKFRENKDDFRFEACSVRDITTELVKKYRISCLAKELSVTIKGDWLVKSDKKWLSFAISQVLDNAIKYSKNGGHIVIQLNKGIVIQDTGIGILPEDLPRLFEEGFTGYNGHELKKATGLGLYMTKQVLAKLNLDITITSEIDQGTSVHIVNASKI